MEQRISIERMEQAVNIFGSFDENIRLLEKEFNVTVTNRDGELRFARDIHIRIAPEKIRFFYPTTANLKIKETAQVQ